MSEGRIEPSDGTLMCSYHGWRFRGDGACVDIPQSLNAKANTAACSSSRAAIKTHPVKVPMQDPPCHERATRATALSAHCVRLRLIPGPWVQIVQDKVWVWADSSPSNFIDCQMVQPALNPFLADIPGIHGADGREMLQMDRPLLRDVPYSESLSWRISTCESRRYPTGSNLSHC